MQLPIWAIYAIMKQKGNTLSEKIYGAFRPNDKWGPVDPTNYEKYQKYITNWRNDIESQPPRSILQKIKQKIYG